MFKSWLCRRTIQLHSCAALTIILVQINIIVLIVLTELWKQSTLPAPAPATSKTGSQGFRVSTDRSPLTVVKTTPVANKLPLKGKLGAKPFSFASYYGHHMVLQQAPRKANIWGYATKQGDTVTISVSGRGSVNTTSYLGPIPSTPVWSAQLPPVSAGGPYNITATSGEVTITLTDILFGDVWICSGQSNMQFTLRMAFGASSELTDAKKHPNIRIFTVFPQGSSKEEFDLLKISQYWSLPSKQSPFGKGLAYFSAVCWLYGKYLSSHLNYPIGLLATSYGGTILEAWSSQTALAKCGAKVKAKQDKRKKKEYNPNVASVLWNAMVHPLLNMTIYGVVWYQGEENSYRVINKHLYSCTFPAMIDDWRERFHEGSGQQTHINFPFGFVQLSAWRRNPTITQGFPDIRWHQTADYGYAPNDRMKNVFMAVTMDLPDKQSIHPRNKQDVAVRLGTAGLAVAYNQTKYSKLNGPYPSLFTVWKRKNTVVIDYDNKRTALDIRSPAGFEVTCIYLSNGAGKKRTGWIPLPIASHDNTSVTLDYSKQCPLSKNMMVASIRYAWRESPCAFKRCAVYNKNSGYPAPPFIKHIFDDQNHVKTIK